MENHHFQWVNPLFLWSFSIAMLVITRGYILAAAKAHPPAGPRPLQQRPEAAKFLRFALKKTINNCPTGII
jgi:hypothetical protein